MTICFCSKFYNPPSMWYWATQGRARIRKAVCFEKSAAAPGNGWSRDLQDGNNIEDDKQLPDCTAACSSVLASNSLKLALMAGSQATQSMSLLSELGGDVNEDEIRVTHGPVLCES